MPRSAPSARSRASATLKWTRPGAITPTFANPEKCLAPGYAEPRAAGRYLAKLERAIDYMRVIARANVGRDWKARSWARRRPKAAPKVVRDVESHARSTAKRLRSAREQWAKAPS